MTLATSNISHDFTEINYYYYLWCYFHIFITIITIITIIQFQVVLPENRKAYTCID